MGEFSPLLGALLGKTGDWLGEFGIENAPFDFGGDGVLDPDDRGAARYGEELGSWKELRQGIFGDCLWT